MPNPALKRLTNPPSKTLAPDRVRQPARRSSVTSRSWKVQVSRSTRSLACGGTGKDPPYPQLPHCAGELLRVGRPPEVTRPAGKLEHPVAVTVESQRDPVFRDQPAYQPKVPAGVLVGSEDRTQHLAGGIVNRQKQCESRAVVAQPVVVAAVDLDQHLLGGHAFTADAMERRSAPARALETGPVEDPAQGLTGQISDFAIPQQFDQVGMIGVGVKGAGQIDDQVCETIRDCIARTATLVAVSNCGLPALAAGGQSVNVAPGNTQQSGAMHNRHLASSGALEDVIPGKLLPVQCRALTREGLTFFLSR